MGYYSRFEITTDKRVTVTLSEDYYMSFDDEKHCESDDVFKWYSADEDIKAASVKCPGVLFTLYRTGEEGGDIEWSFYRDGKSYTAENPEPPAFDESLLE